jgi:hypothetical protein
LFRRKYNALGSGSPSNEETTRTVMGPLVFLLVFTFTVILTAFFIFYVQSIRQLNDTFARLARKYGGTAVPGTPLSRPQAQFHYKGSPVLVRLQSAGNRHAADFTMVQMRWPDTRLRLEVYPERIQSRIGKLMGMEDIEIGDTEFDRRYIISGNDHAAIRQFLTPGVREQIDLLRELRTIDDIYVALAGGFLVVKKRGHILDYLLLQRFAKMALDLFDQAMLTNTDGIDFVDGIDNLDSVENSASICQICGEEITDEMVVCTSCRTPHHRDCWRYYGACSTYGCGQTEFRT